MEQRHPVLPPTQSFGAQAASQGQQAAQASAPAQPPAAPFSSPAFPQAPFAQPQAVPTSAAPAAHDFGAGAVPAPPLPPAETQDEDETADAPRRRSLRPSGGSRRGGIKRPKQTVGLKIGASQLAAATVANNGAPRLVAAVREPLAPGIVAGGEVKEPEALTEALNAFFGKHKLPRRNVRIGLGSERVGVRIFERPQVDDPKQLANAIRFRAHEALPIPIEEAMLDYHLLADAEGPGRVLLVVTYREVVDRYVAACRAAHLELVGADLEAFALLRALTGRHDIANARRQSALIAVAIGHDRSTVAVSDGRVCEFTRVLSWGGANLTQSVADALRVEPEEAEQTKHRLSLAGHSHDGHGEGTQRATAAVRRELQSFARDLASSLKFYQSQPDSLGIGEIALTGGTSHLPGLADELQHVIGVRVRVADPLARLTSAEDLGEQQVGSLAVAIGLGIED